MKIVVLDAATLGEDLDLSILREAGETTIYAETEKEDIPSRIQDADVVICNKARLNQVNLKDAAHLGLIAVTATGYDNIDVAYCRTRGIGVANVAGYSTNSVAQVTIATVLELATHLNSYRSYVASGEYSSGACFNRLTPVYHEISGMTWGIIGYGNIGAKVAHVAEAFGCRVIAYTRTPKDGVTCVPLETLCRESDIITVHCPLTDMTRGLIGGRELSQMKENVILVNEARGAVMDEAAVADAVLAGRVLYGCDVYSKEPFDSNHPYAAIMTSDRVCLTPHMAWGAYEARMRCIAEIAENIKAFANGARRNRVD